MSGPRRSWSRPVRIAVLLAVIVLSAVAVVAVALDERREQVSALAAPGAQAAAGGEYTFDRLAGPGRTVVRDAAGTQLATFTDGARSVAVTGKPRVFTEPRFTTAAITNTVRIRLAPQPWSAGAERAPWFAAWFTRALGDTDPDVLAIALEYTDGAPAERNTRGVRVAGDATFGPDSAEGRLERSDFYDYLGINWTFDDGVHERHGQERYGSLDCSGFVRMVFGYRSGYPLLGANVRGPGLPRRAWAMSELGPGAPVIPDTGERATDYAALQPGDVLFFNLEPQIGPRVSHTGIYLGIDNQGHHRVLSSRKVANGPTFGDAGGVSLLDENGTYARAFRAAKRL